MTCLRNGDLYESRKKSRQKQGGIFTIAGLCALDLGPEAEGWKSRSHVRRLVRRLPFAAVHTPG